MRDGAPWIAAAIESALAQDCRAPFELVVVDDGSRDDTARIAARCAERDARVRVIQGAGEGLVSALNLGLDACRGEWVARLDADDLAHPSRLRLQLAAVEADDDIDVIDARVEFFASDGGSVPEGMQRYADWVNRVCEPEDFARLRFREACVVHPAATFRREIVRALGGYREGGPEDFDLWLRMHEEGCRFRKLPQHLVRMRDHEARQTRSSPRYSRQAFVRTALAAMLRGPLQKRVRYCIIGGGTGGKQWQRGLEAAGRRAAAIVDVSPRRIGTTRSGVPVVAPSHLPELDVELALVVVGGRLEVEEKVRELIHEQRPDWCEGRDYFFVVV